jgi:hypothetical protein
MRAMASTRLCSPLVRVRSRVQSSLAAPKIPYKINHLKLLASAIKSRKPTYSSGTDREFVVNCVQYPCSGILEA